MTSNFIEFIKVFIVVFTFSGLILSVRHFMTNIGDSLEVEDENIIDVVDSATVPSSDVMDYDGMGNYGRFPKVTD
tara:strand:+ start:428 stop:652 length:225 start_codon:yes stop_codon:yes gene_type:complete